MPESYETLKERDAVEVERSRHEALDTKLEPCQVDRYLSPSPDTVFPLEYAFYLIGDVVNKTVLDFGCGNGESVVVLAHKGARVIGLDISPELIALARRRVGMQCVGLREPELLVRSAYETGLPDASVDVVLSNALLHHLDLPTVLKEIRRILKPGGRLIIHEPVRLSSVLALARKVFPERGEISEYEHPLTRAEYEIIKDYFPIQSERAFRLPLISFVIKIGKRRLRKWYQLDCRLLGSLPFLRRFAGIRVAAFTRE